MPLRIARSQAWPILSYLDDPANTSPTAIATKLLELRRTLRFQQEDCDFSVAACAAMSISAKQFTRE